MSAAPKAALDTLTDIDRLPSWNERSIRVVERPSGLAPAAAWVVEFHAMGRTEAACRTEVPASLAALAAAAAVAPVPE